MKSAKGEEQLLVLPEEAIQALKCALSVTEGSSKSTTEVILEEADAN